MIRYLLDTCVCIDLIRSRSGRILSRLRAERVGAVGISSLTFAELRFGVARSSDPGRNLVALINFCAPLDILPFDAHAAIAYGDVRLSLERDGTPIGPIDTLIAAHAIALKTTLVTSNEREFRRVPQLHLENWSG